VLISGPVALADPLGVKTLHVETTRDMLREVETALPSDIFIGVAAVADWHVAKTAHTKIKKNPKQTPCLTLVENPDILATISKAGPRRPKLVVGFAAGEIPKIPINLTLLKGCSIVGVFWGSFTEREPEHNQENLHELLTWLALPFVMWVAWLLLFYVDSLILALFRKLGLCRTVTNHAFQHVVIISLISLLAALLVRGYAHRLETTRPDVGRHGNVVEAGHHIARGHVFAAVRDHRRLDVGIGDGWES